jgi:hypothetical protein
LARNRVERIKKFYTHLFIYVIGVIIFIAKTYFGAPFNFWPIKYINCFFMWAWTFIIAVQGLRLFFREKVFGTKWEQKKVQEFLNNDKQNKWE